MGIIVEPGEKGPDCSHATPDLWPSGSTPKFLLCNITGMTPCPGWLTTPTNWTGILTQMALNPCMWEWRSFPDRVWTSLDADGSHLQALLGGNYCFFHHIAGVEVEHFTNQMKCPPAFIVPIGGTGYVDKFDFPGRAYQQAHDFNFMPVGYTKFEYRNCPAEPAYVTVRRFGNVRTPTNIAIKFDATHYDQWEMFEKED